MEKNFKDKLREILLFTFVIISIALITFQWTEGILGDEVDITPGFVRPTLNNFEVDDEAYENWNQLDVTPTHQDHKTLTPEGAPTPGN
jgi:hypothetical protein